MRVVIVANGVLKDPQKSQELISPGDFIIAADGGSRNCQLIRIKPSLVIGDLDSITSEERDTLESEGTQLIVHPKDKDQTDLELSLQYAVDIGVKDVRLLGLFGGRLDQTIANILLLSRKEWKDLYLTVIDAPDTAYLLREHRTLSVDGDIGDIVSLIPLSPEVTVIRTKGLRWPLDYAKMMFGTTLGVSNEMIETICQIRLESGNMLITHIKI